MKKPYVVEVEETYRHTVIIYAEDADEAYETAEELCNEDEISIDSHHFSSRLCTCTGEANEADLRGYAQFDASGAIAEPPADSEAGLLQEAKKLIRDFNKREYGEETDFDDETAIPVAWTDYEDQGLRVQVNVDLPARKIRTYINGYLVSSRGSDDLEEFIGDLEFALDFDDLVTITDEEMELYESVNGHKEPDLKE